MLKAEPVENPTPFGVLSDSYHRATVLIAKSQAGLDTAHYRYGFQVGPQLLIEIAEILAVAVLPDDTKQTHHAAIQFGHHRAQRAVRPIAEKLRNVLVRGLTYLDSRPDFSTDSNSAIAASIVQGLGAAPCRHILESGPQSPPNGKLSSW